MNWCYELRMNSAVDSLVEELRELLPRIQKLDGDIVGLIAEGRTETERFRSAHEIGQAICQVLEEADATLKIFNGCFTLCENAAADQDPE